MKCSIHSILKKNVRDYRTLRPLLLITACCILLALCGTFSVWPSFAAAQKGDEVLTRLLDGNKRFVAGHPALKNTSRNPYAVVVTCSDSTVAPEIIFDQGLGDIFVIRTAANVLDAISVGSIEYAVRQLHAPLLILVGHDKCDIVSAALEAKEKSDDNIWIMLRKIMPAVKKASARGGTREEIYRRAVRENVLLQYKYLLRKSPLAKKMAASGELKIVTGIFHEDSSKVEILGN